MNAAPEDIVTSISICRTHDLHRDVTVWAMIETFATGQTKVTTVGSNTMDAYLGLLIAQRLEDIAAELKDEAYEARPEWRPTR